MLIVDRLYDLSFAAKESNDNLVPWPTRAFPLMSLDLAVFDALDKIIDPRSQTG